MKQAEPVVLVDMDIVLYRATASAQKRKYLVLEKERRILLGSFGSHTEAKDLAGEDFLMEWHVVAEPEYAAFANVNTTIDRLQNKLGVGADNFVYFLSGPTNFRKEIAVTKPYKGNRDENSKPYHYHVTREWIKNKFNPVESANMEADDAISIYAYSLHKKGEEYIVCTIDKDLDQIPGKHYDWVKDNLYEVNPNLTALFFFQQMISGDATDNIPGIPGRGGGYASKILTPDMTVKDMEKVVYKEYINGYGYERAWDVMLEQGRLLYLLVDAKAPLWSPQYIVRELDYDKVKEKNGGAS